MFYEIIKFYNKCEKIKIENHENITLEEFLIKRNYLSTL